MSEDQQLLWRLHRGDPDALCRLYEKYKDDLLTVGVSVLCDIHTAEDCLHDVFVRFAKTAGDLVIRRSLKGYLIRCVINRARNLLKKGPKQSIFQIEESDLPTTLSNPVGQLIGNEESTRVFQALAKLPDEQHEVVALHFYGEMKFKEIASFLDISINTV
ncbi:MAG: RNA polymerase sigma factor, partial [Planctomycetota bacterium]